MEVFGVDWEGLHDDALLQAQRANNYMQEGSTSWIGRAGPPENLNEVLVESPTEVLEVNEIQGLDAEVAPWIGSSRNEDVVLAWTRGLMYARRICGNIF